MIMEYHWKKLNRISGVRKVEWHMKDYESFRCVLSDAESRLKSLIMQAQKLDKSIAKNSEKGDYRSISRDVSMLTEVAQGISEATAEVGSVVSAFDYESFFSDGTFATSLLSECEALNIDTAGEFPVYEMFPYRVRIDSANQEVWLDRKKIQSMRPSAVAEAIRSGLDRLDKVRFDAPAFITELYNAYHSYVVKHGLKEGAPVAVLNIYRELVPMARFRKDYDQQAFAFDIARLYRVPETRTKEGARVVFSSSRGNQIRILDEEGREMFIGSISFDSPM